MRAHFYQRQGKIQEHAHVSFWGPPSLKDSSAPDKTGERGRNNWGFKEYTSHSHCASSFPFLLPVPSFFAPIHLVMPGNIFVSVLWFLPNHYVVLELCDTDVPYPRQPFLLLSLTLSIYSLSSAYQGKRWGLEVWRKGVWKEEGSHGVPVLVHTYFPLWSWQMMSWTNVSLNEWAPSPLPQMPWQNPLGMARGPRHTAAPCHCRHRGTVCDKGEVLNLLTPRNKDHCEYVLPPLLFWFPLIQGYPD